MTLARFPGIYPSQDSRLDSCRRPKRGQRPSRRTIVRNLVGQPPPRHHTVGIGGGQPDRRVSDRSGREPAARAAPTLRKETRRTQTRSPATVSESSVQASSTTNTVTGSSTASAAAATLARHAGNRSASSCAGMTTTILRNTGAARADWRPKRCSPTSMGSSPRPGHHTVAGRPQNEISITDLVKTQLQKAR
jgi:hypothetical protein